MASPLPPETPAYHPLSTNRGDKAADWLRDRGKLLGGVGAAIVVAGLAGVLWRSNARATERRAEQALLNAEAVVVQGGGAAAEQRLREVATRYGGTPAGAQAQLLLAQALYEQGKYQDGLAALTRAKPPERFGEAFDVLRAAGFEGLNRGAEAAKVYERLASGPGVVPRRRDELRAAAARAYQLGNDKANAVRLWRLVLDEGSGPVVDEARVRIGELS